MGSLRAKSSAAINDWWAQELGVNASELSVEQSGVQLSGNALLPGLLAYRRGSDLRVAAALGKLETIQGAMIGCTLKEIFCAEFWPERLPQFTGRVTGPATLFYADRAPAGWARITPPDGVSVRGLAECDAGVFEELTSHLSELDREHGGLDFSPQAMWGAFVEERMVAAASCDLWPGRLAHLGVAVHPDFRGRKIGQAVAMEAAKGALAQGRIVQFRVVQARADGMDLAIRLGFEPFAETIYVHPPEG